MRASRTPSGTVAVRHVDCFDESDDVDGAVLFDDAVGQVLGAADGGGVGRRAVEADRARLAQVERDVSGDGLMNA
jgi:hypothetical protein